MGCNHIINQVCWKEECVHVKRPGWNCHGAQARNDSGLNWDGIDGVGRSPFPLVQPD